MSKGNAGMAALLLTFTVANSTAAAVKYSILDLGYMGQPSEPAAIGHGTLNAAGQVAGYSYFPGTYRRAFRAGAGVSVTPAGNLGTLGGAESAAYAINASGQVVGLAYADNLGAHAMRTTATGNFGDPAADLGNLGSPYRSVAYGINDSGQAVDYSHTANIVQHAFRTAPNAAINPATDDLGVLPGGSYSIAYAINNSGQVVGESATVNGIHAFRTSAGGFVGAPGTDLGTLGGGASIAHGINAAGQAVGASTLPGNQIRHAFPTTASGLVSDPGTDLGTLGGTTSEAFAINASGQVVGSSLTAADPRVRHAFFADASGPMQDLNDLVAADRGWTLVEALGINDGGQIAGYGYAPLSMGVHAFLLTPVPEPGMVASVFGAAALWLARRRRSAPPLREVSLS